MKKPWVQLSAVTIGFVTALAAFNLLRRCDNSDLQADKNLKKIGEIQSVTGQVERRLPKSVKIETVPGPRSLHNQDLIITQNDSSAVLILGSSGTTLKLGENTRFIAELDPAHQDALIGTLLDGSAQVLNPGKSDSFRLFRDGREIALENLNRTLVPVIPAESQTPPAVQATATPGLIITATRPDEPTGSPRPAATPITSGEDENATSREVLTDQDIIRQLRGQTGFFQRCYLNYIHRNQKPGAEVGPGGTVIVSFVIQSNGKVTEAKIVRSDFKDSTLHNCINEVIGRTLFKGFKGNPIPVLEFPISLQ